MWRESVLWLWLAFICSLFSGVFIQLLVDRKKVQETGGLNERKTLTVNLKPSQLTSCRVRCDTRPRPGPRKFAQSLQRFGKSVGNGGKSKPKMCGRIEAISRREQNSPLRDRLAESAAVLPAEEPRKRSHSTTRANPAKRISMFGHECVQLPKILLGALLRSSKYGVAFAHRNLGQQLSRSIVRDLEIHACIPVLLAPPGVMLDHPPSSHSSQRKRFRKIMNHCGVG